MNYVVGALLMYQTEEVAFWTFTQLMWGVGLRSCFLRGLPLVMSCLDAQERRSSGTCFGCTSTLRRRG